MPNPRDQKAQAAAMPAKPDKTSAKARTAAIVMAATMVLWMGAQFLGGQFGLPVRYVFLFDLAAIAALFWALIVTYQVWTARRQERD